MHSTSHSLELSGDSRASCEIIDWDIFFASLDLFCIFFRSVLFWCSYSLNVSFLLFIFVLLFVLSLPFTAICWVILWFVRWCEFARVLVFCWHFFIYYFLSLIPIEFACVTFEWILNSSVSVFACGFELPHAHLHIKFKNPATHPHAISHHKHCSSQYLLSIWCYCFLHGATIGGWCGTHSFRGFIGGKIDWHLWSARRLHTDLSIFW